MRQPQKQLRVPALHQTNVRWTPRTQLVASWYLGSRARAAVPVVKGARAQVRLEANDDLLVVKVARARVELGVHARGGRGCVMGFACKYGHASRIVPLLARAAVLG